MSKQTPKTRKINYFQLTLGIILNILVIIIAFVIYHEVFRKNNTTPEAPLVVPEAETVPEEEIVPE